jgi:hypothetical protein
MTTLVPQNGRAPEPIAYQQIVGAAAATALTIPDGAVFAELVVSGQPVRWRADGPDPTAAVGMPLAVGVHKTFFLQSLSTLRFIETAASATIDVTYFDVA